MEQGDDMDQIILYKIGELSNRVGKIEETLCKMDNSILEISKILKEHVRFIAQKGKEEETMVTNLQNQLKLFPEMFSYNKEDMPDMKNISSSIEGLTKNLENLRSIAKKTIDKQ